MERELRQIQETQECSFKPKIIAKKKQSSPERSSGPVHSRLYTLATQKPKKVKDYPSPAEREERELRECTFTPNTNVNSKKSSKPEVKKPVFKTYGKPQAAPRTIKSAVKSKEVPGYGDSIARLRKAQAEKEQIKERLQNVGRSMKYTGVPTIQEPF